MWGSRVGGGAPAEQKHVGGGLLGRAAQSGGDACRKGWTEVTSKT